MAEIVADGSTVAIGGTWLSARPMAAIRELVRAGRRRLTVVSLTGSLDVELLVGAGVVSRLVFCFVSLGPFGLAPRFRAAAEAGAIELDEHSGHGLTVALEAASRGVDHLPFHGPAGTSLAGRYPTVASPATGAPIEISAALPVDVALLHAEAATPDGHVLLAAGGGLDVVTARAADHVVVTTERLVDRLPSTAGGRYLAPAEVHTIVEAPWGAHPLAQVPDYGMDWRALLAYADRAQAASGFDSWLVEDVLPPEEERRRRLAPDHRRTLIAVGRGGPATAGAEEVGAPTPSTGPATPVERIVVALAEQLRDGDTAVLGSFTPIGYAAVLLAKHTHAPRLDFSAYGFGGTDIGWLGYLGVEGRAVASGYGPLPIHELVGALRFRGSLAFEPVRPVQVDGSGGLNLRRLRSPTGREVRLPGTAGATEVVEMHRRPVGYLVRHDRRTCVEAVDDVSLQVHLPHEQRAPFRLVTDLAVLEFTERGWRVVSRHPRVTAAQLLQATGFPLHGVDDAPVTAEPDPAVLDVLRRVVDPLGVTELERLEGGERRRRLRAVLEEEERRLTAGAAASTDR